MYGNLSLRQSPPFSVPVRFFITAPVFGALGALILLFVGKDLLVSRWTPGMLAVTHSLVLGFFASVMFGAIQQLLPVVAGTVIQRPRFVSGLIHFQWVPGVILLVFAFMHPMPILFLLSTILLTGAILSFVSIILYSLHQSESKSDSVPGIKIAAASLFFTLIMGITLALGYTGIAPLWRPSLTNLHLSWGLIGWIAVLIMALAIQMVPMFQITTAYPKWIRKNINPVILILLLIKTTLAWPGIGGILAHVDLAVDVIIALCLCSFAVVTLRIQKQARRKIRDVHKDFWRLGMVNLIAVALLWIAALFSTNPMIDVLTTVVFLFGFAMAVVTGMLLKIVSFLIWLHLSAMNDGMRMKGQQGFHVPKMKTIISTKKCDALLKLLMVAELSLITALISPVYFTTIAALLWFCQFCLLTYVLGNAVYRYYQIINESFALEAAE